MTEDASSEASSSGVSKYFDYFENPSMDGPPGSDFTKMSFSKMPSPSTMFPFFYCGL